MNSYGKNIRLEIFGESHNEGVGIIIDGLPSGIKVDWDYIDAYMSRRKSDGVLGTKRVEDDIPEVLSGIYKGYTSGSPLTVFIRNKNKHSESYNADEVIPRPSHADYTAHVKYKGYADMRGGGHFSGRLTAPLVFAGALIASILKEKGISIAAHILKLNNIRDDEFDKVNVTREELERIKDNKFPVINSKTSELMIKEIESVRDKGDSLGAIIECAIVGVNAGVGSPFFLSCESAISSLLFSIPSIKGVEFGEGFNFANFKGSECNDMYYYDNACEVKTYSNNNGGILGGITNGMPLIFKCIVKPTPSIFLEQNTINLTRGENIKHTIQGRHDPCIALRAVPVIEAAAAIAIYDLMLDNKE